MLQNHLCKGRKSESCTTLCLHKPSERDLLRHESHYKGSMSQSLRACTSVTNSLLDTSARCPTATSSSSHLNPKRILLLPQWKLPKQFSCICQWCHHSPSQRGTNAPSNHLSYPFPTFNFSHMVTEPKNFPFINFHK